MESVAQSDALIRLAFVTGLASAAFTTVVLFWMTALRIFTRFHHRRLDRQHLKWLEVLIEGRRIVDADLCALPRHTAFYLMRQWVTVMEQAGYLHEQSSRTAREEQLRVAADHARLEEFAHELLEDGTREEVMGAVIALGYMKASRATWALRRYLRSPDKYISAASAEALVRIDSSAAVKDLVEVIPLKPDWPEHVLARIFRQIDSMDVEFIITSLAREHDYGTMLRLFRAVSRNNFNCAVVVLEWLLKNARTDADLTECIYSAHQEDHVQTTVRMKDEHLKRISVLTAAALDLERADEEISVEKLLSQEPPVIRDHVLRQLKARDHIEFTIDS